jgi:hypothetical protein
MIKFESRIDIPAYILDSIKALLKSITDKDLEIIIRPLRKKRSLDSNAYYWALVTKLARLLNNSKQRQHNLLLRSYGVIETIDGKIMAIPIPDTDEAENTVLESATYHLQPTSRVKTGSGGEVYRIYKFIRGSSSYDSKDMAHLIKGTIEECRQIGIPESEIMTPTEKEQLRAYGLEV